MTKLIFKIAAVFLALAFVAYVGLSLAFGTWSPTDWTDYNQTQVGDGDTDDTTNPTTPGNSDKDKPTTPDTSDENKKPTTPDTSDEDKKPTTPDTSDENKKPTTPDTSDENKKPTTPDTSDEEKPPVILITAETKAYIDRVNAELDALNTINEDGLLFAKLAAKAPNASEEDKETEAAKAALEADKLIMANVIYDGYWWASLEVRQQAARILINAGLRSEGDIPTEELPYPSKPSPPTTPDTSDKDEKPTTPTTPDTSEEEKPSVPLSTEAQNFIDAVNAVLDTRDIRQYHLLAIISCSNALRESDFERKEVNAAIEAAQIILNNSKRVVGSSVKYSLDDDSRLEAASIMKAAGLRETISWID